MIRAIRAFRREFNAKNLKRFGDALYKSTLLVEAKRMPAGGYIPLTHQTEGDRSELRVFTDMRAYRRRNPAPTPSRSLIADNAGDLICGEMHSRRLDGHDLVINPGGPKALRLHCSGAALLLRRRYPVIII
ncbi:MAG: SseB family protein [Elusimicrobia bacterium]|nr:SseB family protein [Elusimicrobiota bacterium]